MNNNVGEKAQLELKKEIKEMGLSIHESVGANFHLLGLVGDTQNVSVERFSRLNSVEKIIKVQEPYKKANRMFHPENTVVDILGTKIGDGNFKVIAGPCSVESEEQIVELAKEVKASGASFLRGGAFKPRTSPYSFQGLETEGISLLTKAREVTGLPIVSEIMGVKFLDQFIENVDIIQVGARNMQNFDLLKALGQINKPILLKRGLSATIEEWLMSAEYILAGGNKNVILCERGIRTFEKYTRNTLDLSAIPVIKKRSHLPVIVDPSHATGEWWMVESLAKAALAVGADGLMIEVHNNPEKALCDGYQSLKPKRFKQVMQKLNVLEKLLKELA